MIAELGKLTVVWGSRLVVGLTLLLGAGGKCLYFNDFRKLLAAYQLVPVFAVSSLSVLLVVIEFFCGVFIFAPFAVRVSGWCAIALFSLFISAIAINLLRGNRNLPCGCFGRSSEVLSWLTVLRNLALVGLAILSMGQILTLPVLFILSYVFGFISQMAIRSETPGTPSILSP